MADTSSSNAPLDATPPKSVEERIAETLKQTVEASKKKAPLDHLGAMAQLVSTVFTLLLLVYGFVKFSKIDDLVKRSESASKLVTAKYDTARRIRVNSDISINAAKYAKKPAIGLFDVTFSYSITNISKRPIVITGVTVDCFSGKNVAAVANGTDELFRYFNLPGGPEEAESAAVTWTPKFERISRFESSDQTVKQAFSTKDLKYILKDLDEYLGPRKAAGGSFTTVAIQPDEIADEGLGFLVRAPEADHVACKADFRYCYRDDERGEVCSPWNLAESGHLWAARSHDDQKE